MTIKNLVNQHGLKLLSWIYLVVVFIFLLIPILVLIVFSFEDSRFPSIPWTGITLNWYSKLMSDGALMQALKNSLLVSPFAATIASVIGFFAAYALNRSNFPGKTLISSVLVIPILIPPLILGVAFLGLLSRLNLQGHLYSVLLTHIVLLIAPAIAVTQLRLSQMPKSLEEAAWNLGATERQALFRVVLPWAMPGIVGGWLLAFTFSFDEFTIAWFVSGFDQTLPVAVSSYMAAQLDPSLNAIGTLVFLLSLLVLVGVELYLVPLMTEKVHKP